MKFTDEMKDRINARYAELRKKCIKPRFEVKLGITGVCRGCCVCDIDELSQTIDQLTAMKKAIEDETGLIV